MARHYTVKGYRLRNVSGCSPESYDVYWADRQVGHLRQNAGHCTAEVHGIGRADAVYEVSTIGDGTFDEPERMHHLGRAVEAINDALTEGGFFRRGDRRLPVMGTEWSRGMA